MPPDVLPESRAARHYRILLIEDDAQDIELCQHAVATIPGVTAEVTTAETLAAGLALAQSGQVFDVILLDLRLPNGDGKAVFRAVATAYPDAPIIILTGIDDSWYRRDLLEMGARSYLYKGRLTPDALDCALAQAMAWAPVLREMRTIHRRAGELLTRLRP